MAGEARGVRAFFVLVVAGRPGGDTPARVLGPVVAPAAVLVRDLAMLRDRELAPHRRGPETQSDASPMAVLAFQRGMQTDGLRPESGVQVAAGGAERWIVVESHGHRACQRHERGCGEHCSDECGSAPRGYFGPGAAQGTGKQAAEGPHVSSLAPAVGSSSLAMGRDSSEFSFELGVNHVALWMNT